MGSVENFDYGQDETFSHDRSGDMDLSRETVHFYLKGDFAKTGVSR